MDAGVYMPKITKLVVKILNEIVEEENNLNASKNKKKTKPTLKMLQALWEQEKRLSPSEDERNEFRRRPKWPEMKMKTNYEYRRPSTIVIVTEPAEDALTSMYKIEQAFIKFIKEKRNVGKRKMAEKTG